MKLDKENNKFIFEGEEEIKVIEILTLKYMMNERLPGYITRDYINTLDDLKSDLRKMWKGDFLPSIEMKINILKELGYTVDDLLETCSQFVNKFFEKDGRKKEKYRNVEPKIVKINN